MRLSELTDDVIDGLKAGQETDVLMAEAMGKRWFISSTTDELCIRGDTPDMHPLTALSAFGVWEPSEDANDALEVWDALPNSLPGKSPVYWVARKGTGPNTVVSAFTSILGVGIPTIDDSAGDFPLAVCKAYLKAWLRQEAK